MKQSHSTDISNIEEQAKKELNFLGINQETLTYVIEAAQVLRPHKNEIIDRFYGHLLTVDHLQNIIAQHSTIDRLRQTMDRYLEQFFQGEIDQEYIKTRKIIGHVHSRIHLTADHFISAHHLMIHSMTLILMENMRRDPHRMMQMAHAVQKLAAYDQQLIVNVYMEETFKSFLFNVSDLLNDTIEVDSIKELVTSMDKQIEESHSVATAMGEISATIHEVANHAERVADGSDTAVQSADQSKVVIDEALNNIEQVGKVYVQLVDQVSSLNQEIEHIQQIANIIQEISEQTNLLALNAAIEAARAGEHGRGFSVVAGEVRNLSERTKQQVMQITTNLTNLRDVSAQLIQQIKQTGDQVDQSVAGAEHAGDALSKIITAIQENSESNSHIATMTEEQSAVVTDISERNSSIHDHSIYTQGIAKETANRVFQLSSEMDRIRNSFFQINIKLNAKDLVRVAKTDHLLWKWRIYNMLLGIQAVDSSQVTTHQECRLGKWYYGDLPQHIKNSATYKELEQPHQEVHHYARLAVERYEQADLHGAEEALKKLEQASEVVIAILTELEASLDV
ncbi:chemotaxis protein [Ammoniphilus oxalaticus]|uniref:Chemotaxis protein n=2 Tax=Ammoniphilus oxalaticus TaxID=66863 RepID=A0A419SRL3_9BACL|nr:chemotaxis protein [Ammoniphilus oxalaticus]